MVNRSRRAFKAGEVVCHSRFGLGHIIDEWGNWIDVDERGRQLPVNGAGIYEVRFKSGEVRRINRGWLSRGREETRSGAKPVWQLT
jgi:hypothetical protein